MTTLDTKQADTAQELVREVKALRPDMNALWQLSGADGSGKTTILRRVAEQLPSEKLVPILVSAPAGQIDSAPIALLETARQLKSNGLLNGEMSIISDPAIRWREKMAAITKVVEKNHQDVVILCDEPTNWYPFQESLVADTPGDCARSLAEWMVKDAPCRRVVAGWSSNDRPAGRTWAPRLNDGRELLVPDMNWEVLWEFAAQLRDSLTEPVPNRSALEMKLLVALSALASSDEVARLSTSEATANVMLAQVFDQFEQGPDFSDLGKTLARLALARTDLDEIVLDEFTSGLEPLTKSLIERCLFDWNSGRGELHPLVRHEVLTRASEPRRGATNLSWRLSETDRIKVHDRLKSEYCSEDSASPRDGLESLHHELLGTPTRLRDTDVRLQFVEQLDEIGRTLSHFHHEHRRAAELFRLAVRLAPEHAYSHHYLAFNLDWLAEEARDVEDHYKRAIQLQPTHPWWWSRWISYLATRGRFHEAKLNWRQAVDALSISEDGSPD